LAAGAKAKAKKPEGLIAKTFAPKSKPKPVAKPTAPTRITKTQPGKFISKSALEKTEPARKKRGFWG